MAAAGVVLWVLSSNLKPWQLPFEPITQCPVGGYNTAQLRVKACLHLAPWQHFSDPEPHCHMFAQYHSTHSGDAGHAGR